LELSQEGILSQAQIFGENVILCDLLELKPFAISNTVYDHIATLLSLHLMTIAKQTHEEHSPST
jgi:hypothetical protein